MFFNPESVLKYNFLMNFVVSERGSGKTFSTLKYCVEKFLECGEQFVYVRRTETELELSNTTLLLQLQKEGYFNEEEFLIKNNIIYCNGKMMGRCLSINTSHNLKSVSFPEVKTIIYDEFISENNRYLKYEPRKLLSLIETVGRMRDIQVIMLGNKSSIYNPYFIYFGIKPEGKNLTRFRGRSILIYEFKGEEYREAKRKTKFGKLIDGTEYGNFMLNNEAIDDNYDFVDDMKGSKKFPIRNLIIDGHNIVMYECVHKEDCFVIWYKQDKNIPNLKTINYDKMLKEGAVIENIRSSPASMRIINSLKRGSARFDSVPTKLLVENFIF